MIKSLLVTGEARSVLVPSMRCWRCPRYVSFPRWQILLEGNTHPAKGEGSPEAGEEAQQSEGRELGMRGCGMGGQLS